MYSLPDEKKNHTFKRIFNIQSKFKSMRCTGLSFPFPWVIIGGVGWADGDSDDTTPGCWVYQLKHPVIVHCSIFLNVYIKTVDNHTASLLTSVTGFMTALTTDRSAITVCPSMSRKTPPHSSLFSCRKNSWPGCTISEGVSDGLSQSICLSIRRNANNSLVLPHANKHCLLHTDGKTVRTATTAQSYSL